MLQQIISASSRPGDLVADFYGLRFNGKSGTGARASCDWR
ncbi:hypothetical protein ACVV37_16110 [Escherichia coli]